MPARRATAAVVLGLTLACERGAGELGAGERADAVPPAAPVVQLADSAAGDSAAFATLPPPLQRDLDVRAVLTPAALRDTARVRCDRLGGGAGGELRHRLRARLGDRTALVVFVRADSATGALRRVEVVRREPGRGQRGFIWNAPDETTSVEWPAGRNTAPEAAPLPRGGPAPRALRGIGRRLLALPCAAAPAATAEAQADSA